jgi:hypothetical protein
VATQNLGGATWEAGIRPQDMGPDQFSDFTKSEIRRWSAVVRAANIKE